MTFQVFQPFQVFRPFTTPVGGVNALAALIKALFGNDEQGGMWLPGPNTCWKEGDGNRTRATQPGDTVGVLLDTRLGATRATQGLTNGSSNWGRAESPHSVEAAVTGDIDVRAHLRSPDWDASSSGSIQLMNKYGSGSGRSWFFERRFNGFLGFSWTPTGSHVDLVTAESTEKVPFEDNATGWVRATLDVDNGAGQWEVRLYTSLDGTVWTLLGDVMVGTGPTSIHAGTLGFNVGNNPANGAAMSGAKLYRAQVRNGIDGPVVLDCDFSAYDEGGSFAGGAGETWTLQVTATILPDGNHATQPTADARPLLLETSGKFFLRDDGIDDSLVATFSASLGTACTIVRADQTGVVTQTAQTVGTTYDIMAATDIYGLCIVDRALTAGELADLQAYMAGRRP